jgi:rifamycin polyketide synthase modules 1, 2 and 3
MAVSARTLDELLRYRAEHDPDRVAYRFVDYGEAGESVVSEISYGELDRRARASAVAMATAGTSGDRVMVACSPGLPYIAALYGCLYAGMIAVPASPPGPTRNFERLDAIARDCGATIVVSDTSDTARRDAAAAAACGSPLTGARWLSAQDAGHADDWTVPGVTAESIAFLQYTSGSTAQPKGVMISHGNLLANARAAQDAFGIGPDTPLVNWAPLYHNAGLGCGVTMPLYVMAPAVNLAPAAFIGSPRRWLDVISRYGGYCSTAPDFAYGLCAARISEEAKQGLDLSTWKVAINGAEPVRAEVLDQFAAAFASCGFDRGSFTPVYGLAESTLLVSAKPVVGVAPDVRHVSRPALERGQILPPADADDAQPLVSCGIPGSGLELRIVDPDGGDVGPGTVGEVWLHGSSVAAGYYGAPEATAATFQNRRGRSRRQYLRTGDLGALIDGELYVTGRADDLMIFAGRNIYPQDIEATCSRSDPALAPCRSAAFAVEGEQGAVLVVVQELPRRETTPQERARFAAAIRRRISEGHGLSIAALVLVPAGDVPTTPGGKVQRKACRTRFLTGVYPAPTGLGGTTAVEPEARPEPEAGIKPEADIKPEAGGGPAAPGASEIEYRIRELVALAAGCDTRAVSATEPFATYGLSSLHAVDLAGQLSDWLGRTVSAAIAWNHPDIKSAATWLAGERTAPRQKAASAPDGRSDEPLAIVGMSCRYPGGVASPEDLWELVASGRDGMSGLPEDRGWDLERLYDPDPDHPGTLYTRGGGFLTGAGEFDAGFFEVGPREATAMDPQQRLVLEGAWEALEDAGIDPTSLRGSSTGVFCGAIASDYGGALTSELEGFRLTGTTTSVISGRVAYSLGLEGPAVSVDTACSSSLVAMHLAAQALRSGECSLALAGGVTVLAGPFLLVEFSRQRGLAPDGRCKSYAAGADGTGFSDGMGLVVLERLSDARRNGHTVLAVMRGSAVNQDGASNGLTAPSGPSQERVIRAALASAGLSPADVDVVEGHGTGTKLGDPVEAQALLATYGQDRADGPLRLGSVKSNIGHSSAAAGVAGVIKMVQAMRHGVMPRTLHVDAPSPHVDWDAGAIRLLAEAEPWPDAGRPRRAGVSSFGISGTNAHLILEAAPAEEQEPAAEPYPLPVVPVLLSARTEEALRAQAVRLRGFLTARPDVSLADAGLSLATTRAHLKHRAAVAATDRHTLLSGLAALSAGDPGAEVVQGEATGGKVVFVFPGQGAQWAGMAAALLESSPVFAREVGACGEALSAYVDWRLEDVLRGAPGAPPLERVDVVQPALFAVMAGLAALWRSYGVEPAAVVGHSQGEIAAAYVAGGLCLDDAARIVALRSRLIGERLAGHGAMVSVALPAAQVEEQIGSYAGRASVAAVNGPTAVVVSGDPEVLEELLAGWEAAGVRAKRVPVDYASHSAQVEAIREELLEALAPVTPRPGQVPFCSAAEGRFAGTDGLDAGYWYRNLRAQVGFEAAVRTLAASGMDCFIEVSPHPVLAMAVQETLAAADGTGRTAVIGSLRRDEGGRDRFAMSLAQAHVAGAGVDWQAFYAGSGARRVSLPTYAFQRERFWLAPASGGDPAAAGLERIEHPLLAAAVPVGDQDEWVFTGRLSLDGQPWLADHVMLGSVLAPGAALAELVLAAGQHAGAPVVAELVLEAPLLLAESGSVRMQVTVGEADGDGRRSVAVYSRPQPGEDSGGREAVCHARGVLAGEAEAGAGPASWAVRWPPEGAAPVPVGGLYERLAGAGYEYGPAFQGLRAAWRDGEVVYAEVALPDEQASAAPGFGIHPALLDAALHGALLDGDGDPVVRLPFSWTGIELNQVGAVQARVRISPAGEFAVQVDVAGSDGGLIARVHRLAVRPVDQAQLEAAGRAGARSLFSVRWRPVATGESVGPAAIAVLGDSGVLGDSAAGPGERYADLAALERALAGGGPVPDAVLAVIGAPTPVGGDADAAVEVAGDTLGLVQGWLASEALAGATLVVATRRGVAVGDEAPNVAVAAAWGLVRSAQSEHPGRFVLVDLDDSAGPDWAVLAALAEPQLAVRSGQLLAPRLERAEITATPGQDTWRLETGAVLITGGTGGLGALVARHLAAGGARHLVLASRRGLDAEGAGELAAELEAGGCQVRVAACDVGDRGQLADLLGSLEYPLTAVVHAAGVLDDGVVGSLTGAQLDRVMRPKARGALLLDELTAGLDLAGFVLFSSAAGLMGSPGQGNYAAANAVLDALAARRRAAGQAGVSLAWGLWEQETGMTGALDQGDLARLARAGIRPLPASQGLDLFDQAQLGAGALMVPVRLDLAALAARARAGTLPSLLRGLVRSAARRAAASTGSLAQRLAAVPEAEREHLTLNLVQARVAAVLGHSSGDAIDPGRAFKDLGFDSLTAVELRNQLTQATGLQLPATLVFDHPTPAAVARYLLTETSPTSQAAAGRAVRAPVATGPRAALDEAIAVVGIGCRFPGGADSPEAFWELLLSGRNAVTEVPADRWDVDAFYDPDPDVPYRTYARHGAFVGDVRGFDAALFGITPREAAAIDPQHRLLLETAWHALEHANIAPDSLRDSPTGVFVGIGNSDYSMLAVHSGIPLDAYSATGLASNFAANRVSFSLGLQGPSMVVDTACSSSLVAVHLACQALRGGECDTALAGGVNLILAPDTMIALTKGRMLSPEGQCRTFDAAADGFVRGEGAGMIVLRRLSDAERGQDPILAVIRGGAVNQDGRSNGLTAPSGTAQEEVIRRALAAAGVLPDQVGYVEAHGTGTPLGDPIEIRALTAVLTPRERQLTVGSVKTSIGHLEPAAGIAGLIKTILTLQHGMIPPHLNLATPNPYIPWTDQLTIPAAATPWTEPVRTAGVSSFGLGGTNAHLILASHPGLSAEDTPAVPTEPGAPATITLSAQTPGALAAAAVNLAACLTTDPTPLPDLAWATTCTRATLAYRAAITTTSSDELRTALRHLADGVPHPRLTVRHHTTTRTPQVTMIAPGHGTRLRGALAGLYGSDPAVTETLDTLAAVLGPVTEPPLSILLSEDAPDAEAAEHLQPALYALTLALAAWWSQHGIVPRTVLGHSAGAYAAAALAGIVSVEDGARLSVRRGQLIAALPGEGVMATVSCDPDQLADLGPVRSGEVVIAARNGPADTVLAGPPAAIDEITELMTARGVRTARLKTPVAFHSPQVEAMLDPLREAFEQVSLHPAEIGFVSDSTGLLDDPNVVTPEYWVRHTRQPILFDEALRTVYGRGAGMLIELGTGSLLNAASSVAPQGSEGTALIPSLGSKGNPRLSLAQALGRAWVAGARVEWSRFTTRPVVAPRLPAYPFDRQQHWLPMEPPFPVRSGTGAAALVTTAVAPASPAAISAPGQPGLNGSRASLNGSAVGRPDAGYLIQWLRTSVAAALNLPDPDDIDPDTGLFDLGLTSAMTVELKTGIEQVLGRSVPSTLVFDYPTIGKLSAHLTELAASAPAPEVAASPPQPARAPRSATRSAAGAPEPLAIIGMGCRLPGGAADPRSFWDLLRGGRDATGPVPADRWDADEFYDPDPAAPGKMHSRRGGFLDGPVDGFDADAFGISPREARSMDPQQRLLLEVAWEALSDAGCTPEMMENSSTAVYVGISTSDYLNLLANHPETGEDPYIATGNAFSVAAGRLSYLLGLQGPSMALDTACSSSLVATHLAVRALRAGDADMALVGGVNLMLSPAPTISMTKLRALSPDGRCKAFSASADGYGRGEGCGVIVIKRLSDALASGDRIWALIRGSAVNQDGRSAGLTVPNGKAQQAVVRAALQDAGVESGQVSYVEAHGTGTALGDPLEINSLADVLRPGWASGEEGRAPLWVGSAKTNIGHLEAAAGIAGLIKTALALHWRHIPAHLHFDEPSPYVDWDKLPIQIPRETVSWPEPDGGRIAGVSSFGFSGTNAHVLLEEAPPAAPADTEPPQPRLLVLSAHSPQALLASAHAYADLLSGTESGSVDDEAEPAARWSDIARTAALHRAHLPHRLAVVAASAEQAAASLAAAASGQDTREVRTAQARPVGKLRLIAAYSGQGSQWPGMGDDLMAEPAAAAIIDRCDAVVRELAGWSVRDALTAPRDVARLDRTEVAQPAIFTVQAALTELWRRRGIEPDAVVGHSVGEIAAAYAAGVYDLETACALAVHRGMAMGSTRGAGAMAAVGLSQEKVRDLINGVAGEMSIAAVNSPVSTVVAGDRDVLAALEHKVRARGAFWAIVQEEYAFHSPKMEAVREALIDALDGLEPGQPSRPIYSTVTGERADALPLDAQYWVRNMTEPVLFSQALRAAAGTEHHVVLEIGPKTTLAVPAAQSLDGVGAGVTAIGSMRARYAARETMLDAAGALYVLGYGLNQQTLHPGSGHRAQLPGYPWQRERYWIPGRPTLTGVVEQLTRPEAPQECLYEVAWQPKPLPHEAGGTGTGGAEMNGTGTGPWLIFPDQAGVAEMVGERLRAAGQPGTVLPPSATDPADDFAGLGRYIAALGDAPRGLIHLGPLGQLSVDPQPGDGATDWDTYLARACGPLLTAPAALSTRARAAAAGTKPPRLWIATRGAVAVPGAPCAPAQAPAWGLGRVIAMERPAVWGGQIDLDPQLGEPAAAAETIVNEILSADGEDQVAHRAGERLVARLQRVEQLPARAQPLRITPDRAYLVTGGRGALGLRVARWLFERGARHLILLGRTPLPARASGPRADPVAQAALTAIRQLEEEGATVYTPCADVADPAAMAAVFAVDGAPWPAVRGVIHTAGQFELRELEDIGWADFRSMLRPKVEGSVVLDSLFADSGALDFFVSFGSSWPVIGAAYAGHFAAASHFQDVFAHDRARRGRPALTVDWGWWERASLAAANGTYFASIGYPPVRDELGFSALGRLVASGAVQAAVAPVDWDKLRPVLEAGHPRPLLEAIFAATAAGGEDTELLDKLRAATGTARSRLLEDAIQAEVAGLLGRPAGSRLDRELGFFNAGMDSITSIDLRGRLEKRLGMTLSPTVAFEHPTIADLTGFLLDELFSGTEAAAGSPGGELDQAGAPEELQAQLNDMSEDELASLLAEELEKEGSHDHG